MTASLRITALCSLGLVFGASALRAADPAPGGIRALFLTQLADVEKKVNSLAETMPADKYGWRPAPGVRSIGEVYVHIAGANFMFPSMAGVKPPAGLSRDMEKTVIQKDKIQELLRNSFAHARNAIEGLSDADMAKPVKTFGQETTCGGLFFTMANHMHEHLGQSIAYARTNGVVPPWSSRE